MNHSKSRPINTTIHVLFITAFVIALALGAGQTARAAASPAPVNLGQAAPFAILTKTGVTNVPDSSVTGDIGTSPIAAAAITGFSLVNDSSNTFSRSSQVTGKVYAADYAAPTPANLTTAVSNMQTAYTDAAGRSLPDFTELYSGNLSGRTLAPGLYKWSTGVVINSTVTLAGAADAVWIFQVAGNLTMASGARMVLSGGALANNVFWQVGGGVGVNIGTTAHAEGTILAKKAIHLATGASLNGRALAQTAVTLQKNTIVVPMAITKVFTSDGTTDGWVLETNETSSRGGAINSTASTIYVGDNAANKQYRGILSFDTSTLPPTASIATVTLKIMQQGFVGTDPFTSLGVLKIDQREPFFGASTALASTDFQAGADVSGVGKFVGAPTNGWYHAVLNNTGDPFINRSGMTQFRLRFVMDDNNNLIADYARFYSGDALNTFSPQLVITYYLP